MNFKKVTALFVSVFIIYGVIHAQANSVNKSINTNIFTSAEDTNPDIAAQYSTNQVSSATEAQQQIIAQETSRNPLIYKQLSMVQNKISNMLEEKARQMPTEKKVVVGKGDTLVGLLINKANVAREDAYKLVSALKKVYDPKDIIPGHEITVFFHRDPSIADPSFKGVRIEKDIINSVSVKLDNGGEFQAQKLSKPLYRKLKAYKGNISNSLYVDAKNKGVSDNIIVDLIKMYSWNIDFQREIHNGDKFEVLYEEYETEEGKVATSKSNVLYAKLTLHQQELPFYRYEDEAGHFDYYDDDGRSAKKTLMKTPIDGARLSSGFGMRKHPVLGYSKMHKGLDFAASRGTPIYAAGDGVIEVIGRNGSYGNYIKIRHRKGLETAYAHMKKFNTGIKKGTRVKQGQVIGYVGTTGRSTGPHLHYEVLLNNRQANPASVKLPMGTKLTGEDLKSFKRVLSTAKANFKAANSQTQLAENHAVKATTAKN